MRTRLTTLLLFVAAVALAAPAAAPAATSAKRLPTITLVSPMRLNVGATITVRGRNFSPRAARNTVIFRGPDGRTAFAKPSRASSRKLVLRVPGAVSRLLSRDGGRPVATRFKLRVLTRRFGGYTVKRLSPVVLPVGAPTGPGGSGGGGGGVGASGGVPPQGVCGTGSDYDNDLLENSFELSIGTDPCLKDTDLDGIEDGYEYQSARDLNDDEHQDPNSFLPYPGKRPYPNPLDSADANKDFDRDVLTMAEEQALWRYTIQQGATRTLSPLTYSDGEQHSLSTRGGDGRRQPSQPAGSYQKQQDFLNWATGAGYRFVSLRNWMSSGRTLYAIRDFNRDGIESASEQSYFDHDGDGFVSDDERDEDADGLTNYDESHGRVTSRYWAACYSMERPFEIPYTDPNMLDPDTDGDGVRDGADDQDHDDLPNLHELSRRAASGLDDSQAHCKPQDGLPTPPATNHPTAYGRVNPFNPCLPDVDSRTCDAHPSFENAPAPFDGSPNWYSLN